MAAPDDDLEALLRRAAGGDGAARDELLARHRDRLRRAVAVHFDARLLARLDASDVVQDALLQAHHQLTDYLQQRPLPFFPWLRQLAFDRLAKLRRDHLAAQKRSIDREEAALFRTPEDSLQELAVRLVVSGSTPSQRLVKDEMQTRVRQATGFALGVREPPAIPWQAPRGAAIVKISVARYPPVYRARHVSAWLPILPPRGGNG